MISSFSTRFPQESGLNAVKVNELLAMDLPEKELIMGPWLPKQGLAMIYAPRGVGKTHVSLGVACAVATGTPFLGWEVEKPREVLFIDGEMPANTLQERLSGCLRSIGDRCSVMDDIPLRIITPDLQPNGIPDLASEAGQSLIDQYITENTELIIIDNLSTLVRSGNENEAESWSPVQNWALWHRARERTILFIHHSGKGGQQRGTSRREDVLDTVIALKRPEDYTASQGACFDVYFEKARGIYGDDVIPFNAKLLSNEDENNWEIRPLEDSSFEKVVDLVNDGVHQSEIARRLGLNRSTVSRHVAKAKDTGRL